MSLVLRFGPYFVEPVIAGLDPKTCEPYVASLDLIGCPMVTEDFVVSGTCTEQMYGMCESLWEPDLVRPLNNSFSNCFLQNLERSMFIADDSICQGVLQFIAKELLSSILILLVVFWQSMIKIRHNKEYIESYRTLYKYL